MTAQALTHADILPMHVYAEQRKTKRAEHVARKANRTLSVGPYVTVLFESYDSMWLQVHEMLFIERGGEDQIADELAAYNPMIPNGRELTATLMFEIDDPRLRRTLLGKLGGVEETIQLRVGDAIIPAVSEQDVDRTTADGKASSVQFLHFPFTSEQIAVFRASDTRVLFEITHPNYGHIAVMTDAMKAALALDFA
jgi:Protein of unknown function (DUF3501)